MLQNSDILTTHEAARLLKISRKTLERMRVEGTGPAFCKAGRSVRYRMQDLTAWLESHRFTSTSEAFEREVHHEAL